MERHVLECVWGAFEGMDAEDARSVGVSIEAKLAGRTAVGDPLEVEKLCESPIEKAMCSALHFAEWTVPVEITAQEPVGPYRLDFMVRSGEHRIDVECDGAEFHHHNITMAQYQADRRRDRYMEAQGIHVERFTGTRIWLHAQDCADEIALILAGMVGEGC